MTKAVKSFDELENRQLYEILRLRSSIFVVEQQCIYLDLDGKDQMALHVMGYEGDELVAYTRIFAPGIYEKEASIGRVTVSKRERSKGRGKEIMQYSINALQAQFGPRPIAISAQCYLIKFYSDLGFLEEGEEFLEDGIPHIRMVRK